MKQFEEQVQKDLYDYLLTLEEVDERLPEAYDIESRWASVGESYLADGIREYAQYPVASLGWMMFVGMAVAKLWDEDWEVYSHVEDLYRYMADKSGFDLLDEYILGDVLGLRQPDYDRTDTLVQHCAQRTHTLLLHAAFEPGTEQAFRGYVACLHQLYLMGAAVQLKRMGYHMVQA